MKHPKPLHRRTGRASSTSSRRNSRSPKRIASTSDISRNKNPKCRLCGSGIQLEQHVVQREKRTLTYQISFAQRVYAVACNVETGKHYNRLQQATGKFRTHALLLQGQRGRDALNISASGIIRVLTLTCEGQQPQCLKNREFEGVPVATCPTCPTCPTWHTTCLQWIVFDGFHLLNHPFLGAVVQSVVHCGSGRSWGSHNRIQKELIGILTEWGGLGSTITTYHGNIRQRHAWHGKIDQNSVCVYIWN